MVRGISFIRKFWIVIGLLAMSAVARAQDQTPRVALMPFVVHAQEGASKVQSNITELFVRQLSTEGVKTVDPGDVARALRPGEAVQTEARAQALGHGLQADYAVIGSFNQIGNSISLDAKLLDLTGRKKSESLFAEERGMENLATAINTIVQQMAVHLLSKAIIADVQVRGNDRIEADAIKANLKSKKGELLRPDQVRDDIKAIHKMGYFEKVDAEDSDSPGGKVLTFVVLENPTIQEIQVKGSNKIKEKDILAAISTKAFTVLQRNVVNEDVQKILKLYQQKGYFNAEVTTSIDFPKDPRKAAVTYSIKENSKVYIKEISFKGNKHYSARKLRGVMQTKEKDIFYWITDHGIMQKEILDTDIDRLTVFYHDEGFMDAKVGTPEIGRQPKGFYILIPVEEGERYKVSSVKISGDLLPNQEILSRRLQIKAGQFFSREKLRHDLDTITKTYMDEGYAHADVDPDVKKDAAGETADIDYRVKKGDKFHIGKIFITGNTKTLDRVIRREMKVVEGDLFKGSNVEKSITALKKLDFFEDVEISTSEASQTGIMDLHIKVKEKLTGSLSMGGGYSSDDGLFASGEILQRNLFGRGEYLGLKAYLGFKAQRFMLSFTEPWLFDTPLSAGVDVYDWRRDYSDFTKDAVGSRLRANYPIGNYTKINAVYTLESDRVSNVAEGASVFITSQEGHQIKSSVTLGAERDTTDHPFMPTRGSINTVAVEVSSKYLGSESDFVKYEFHTGWYVPIFWKFVGFARGEIGFLEELDKNNPVPIYERFFLGGINSLRGFDWGDVGPKDTQGEIIGGLKYAVVNFELLFPLIEKIGLRGVVFYDAGNAYLGGIDITEFRTDAGAGLRWNSPLGPLRIEWGYNLDPQEGEHRSRWQFSAGAFF